MRDEITKKIMRRVYLIYYLRLLIRPASLRLALFVSSFVAISAIVSVKNVLLNAQQLSNISDLYAFIVGAFGNTSLAVQIISAAMIVTLMFLMKDLAKNIRSYREMKSLQYIRVNR